jgi:hypothetical protein
MICHDYVYKDSSSLKSITWKLLFVLSYVLLEEFEKKLWFVCFVGMRRDVLEIFCNFTDQTSHDV